MTPPENAADGLGIEPGMTVMESGHDDDVDDGVRADVVARAGRGLVADDHEGRVDAVLMWWRCGDGDLAAELEDLRGALARDAVVWVLTARARHVGHVPPSEIADAARQAGLRPSPPVDTGAWLATGCRRTDA
ncbi:DUF3052 family protein [Streptomyces sp. NPDC048606]|uniref:DUF3052 family protein n=1 Tax=Streptomyces sp. NPDC048606 TaxID=3154726 RepID=UPI00341C7BA6